MTKEIKVGCARPELDNQQIKTSNETSENIIKEEKQKMLKVGKPAPLFTAPAYHEGKFINVNLEDYRGKWVLLCFYPGDFTFV